MILRSVFVGTLLALTLTVAAAPVPGNAGVIFLSRNLEFDSDAEDVTQPLTCLRVALEVQGLDVDLTSLRGFSGEVWVPLMQAEGSVREPIRELMADDPLMRACDALGVEGEWHTDLSQSEAMDLFRSELRERRAPLVPFLHRPAEHVGWNVVVGAETERNGVLISDVSSPRRRVTLNLPSVWTGPVPGAVKWATTPIFTVRVTEDSCVPSPIHQLRSSMRGWMAQRAPDGIELPTHAGARNFMGDDLGGELAVTGAQAARDMADEIVNLETLDDYPMLWRVRTLLPLHMERNARGADFLLGLEGIDADIDAKCGALAAALRSENTTIRHLMSILWNESLNEGMTARDVLDRISLDPPLIADVDDVSPTQRELMLIAVERNPLPWEVRMASTPFGAILIVDSPEQRQRAWDLLQELAGKIETTESLAGELAEMVGASAGASP